MITTDGNTEKPGIVGGCEEKLFVAYNKVNSRDNCDILEYQYLEKWEGDDVKVSRY